MSVGWIAITCLVAALTADVYLILVSLGVLEDREKRLFQRTLEEYTTNLRKLYSADEWWAEEEISVHLEGIEDFPELKKKNKQLKKALKRYNI